MELRAYQKECVSSVVKGFREFQRLLVSVPTGGGKTIIAAELCKVAKGKTIFIAHRDELIEQAHTQIKGFTTSISVEKGDRTGDRDSKVVVASIQTLGNRLAGWDPSHFSLMVIDEAHHALSKSYLKVIDHFNAKVLGITATPDRGDKRQLGQVFEELAYEISLVDLIRAGFLSPIKVKSVPLQIDLSSCGKKTGDFTGSDLDEVLTPYLDAVGEGMLEYAKDRKTLIFLPLVKTAQEFSEILNEKGFSSVSVHGKDPDRHAKVAAFRRGDVQVLCNAMLLTEGFDCPDVDCVIPLRPTTSRPLFCQMVGRGTRIAPGKEDLLLLDFLWLHEKHKLINPAHLIARDEEIATSMTTSFRGGGETDLLEVEEDAKNAREKKLRKELKDKARRKAKTTMDPLEFGLAVNDMELADFKPVMQWHELPVSEGQAKVLDKFNITGVGSRGAASMILDKLFKRSKGRLASPKQLRWLIKYNYSNPGEASFKEASEFLTKKWGK